MVCMTQAVLMMKALTTADVWTEQCPCCVGLSYYLFNNAQTLFYTMYISH